MGRRKRTVEEEPVKRGRGRPRKVAEPEEEDKELVDEEPEEVQTELFQQEDEAGDEAAELIPEKAETERRVYMRGPTGETESFDRENYNKLSNFLHDMPDRSNYSIMVWRVPLKGSGGREYVGMMPLPDKVLDEAIREEHGGGRYFWQLAYDGRFVRPDQLPPDLAAKDLKMAGYVTIAGNPKVKEEEGDGRGSAEIDDLRQHVEKTQQIASAQQDAMMGLLKEQLEDQKKRADSSGQSMIQLFTVLMAGMQQQQQTANQLAQQQTTFMMNMMQLQDKKSEEMHGGRENLLREIIELMKAGMNPDAPQKPFGQVLLESLPSVLDKLQTVPALQNISPRKQAQMVPAAQPVRALPAAPVAAPVAAPEAPPVPAHRFVAEDNPYLTEVVKTVWDHYGNGRTPDDCANAVAKLGTDEQFDKLMETDNDFASVLVSGAWSAYKGGEPPSELLGYARAVHLELQREEEPPEVKAESAPAAPELPAVPPAPPATASGEVKVSP